MKRLLFVNLLILLCLSVFAQKKKNKGTEEGNTASPMVIKGFIDYSIEKVTDRVYLHVNRLDEEFLYLSSLSSGVGSNDIGLDRGQLNAEQVVKFVKAGNKLLLIQPNYGFRAISENTDEIRAVKEAFAQSVIWGFDIEDQSTDSYKIDLTSFLIRDVSNVAQRLSQTQQGNYQLDYSRSVLNQDRIKNFPENTEFDALLTFTGDPKGDWIYSVTPSAEAVTVSVHHSFIKLPDTNYKTRKFDPRAAFYGTSYLDYATPIEDNLEKKFINRHRLVKKDPSSQSSEAVEPIVYYLDRGAPEPIRSALMEGASWWNQAFEAAGFKDAFQVKLLPEGVDPMDARYNIIQWVHRSTRGWSYGASVVDPRTGEIIKGHVTLGSLRVRQDYLIAEGLLSPYNTVDQGSDVMKEMALARLRQLAAHEVGHTLGLAHSYASSAEERASVMDYPHPKIDLIDGKISLDDAYDNKIGAWDKVSIQYGYSEFTEDTNEQEALNKILEESFKNGLSFLSDQDARPQGGSHPYAHLWDNGKSAVDELNHLLKVRNIALNNLGENSIQTGTPYAKLEEVLVPIYFLHRYQVEAAVKLIGGRNYRYALKGDGQLITEAVPGTVQLEAIDALLGAVQSERLVIPESLLKIIPPRPLHMYRNAELVQPRTAPNFDPISAAETIAELTFSLMLNPNRVSRMIEFSSRNPEQPGLSTLINKMLEATWYQKPKGGLQGEIQHAVNLNMLNQLLILATGKEANPQANAIAHQSLIKLKSSLGRKNASVSSNAQANYNYAILLIDRYISSPNDYEAVPAPKIPAGSPIGMSSGCEF